MTTLALDPDKSSIRIRTFAEGFFSRLAHDVELHCTGISGSAERNADDRGTAKLEIPIAHIAVHGTLKHGRVDPNGLSPSEREDLIAKMQKDVFHTRPGGNAVVRVEGSLDAGKATIRVVPPHGLTVERSTAVRVEPAGANGQRASGKVELSLSALGSDVVKGPMNAFRVKDDVEVMFDIVFEAKGV